MKYKAKSEGKVNAAISIRNEGLRILALGSSTTALGNNVRPKKYGPKVYYFPGYY